MRGLDGKVLRIYVKSGSTWSWSKDYVYQQGMLLAAVDTSTTKYFQLDHLGTPRLITGSGGTTLAIHDYYPFGMEAYGTADSERMKFTGHELDSMGTTGQGDDLYNMHARYYNPNIARFISADPLRGSPHSPQSFNLFAYVEGSPTNRFDALGLQAVNQVAPAAPIPIWVTDSVGVSAPMPGYPWGVFGIDPYAWQNLYWWAFHTCLGRCRVDQARAGRVPNLHGAHPCSALSAVSLIHAHQDDAAIVARQLTVPTQIVLGLSGIQSKWGQSNAARYANNFFGLHGGADAPFANEVWYTRGGVAMSAFPSYLASGQSFAAPMGSLCQGYQRPDAVCAGPGQRRFQFWDGAPGKPEFCARHGGDHQRESRKIECPNRFGLTHAASAPAPQSHIVIMPIPTSDAVEILRGRPIAHVAAPSVTQDESVYYFEQLTGPAGKMMLF